jgi:hypothetical protein
MLQNSCSEADSHSVYRNFLVRVQRLIAVFISLLTGFYPQPKNLSDLGIVCYMSWHVTVKGHEIKAVFTHTHTHAREI